MVRHETNIRIRRPATSIGAVAELKVFSSDHGRGTKYHVYGHSNANMALLDTNVALNVALPGSNVALPDSNVALPKRYTKEQLKEKIREICSDWVTADVIATKIGRDVKYVKNHVLPELSDVLEKMYDVPHHPKQKYRIKQKDEDDKC